MKNYTKAMYIKRFGNPPYADPFPHERFVYNFESSLLSACSCVRWTIDYGDSTARAYDECPNCLGYGVPPISPRELR
jgi:hypothetical protein